MRREALAPSRVLWKEPFIFRHDPSKEPFEVRTRGAGCEARGASAGCGDPQVVGADRATFTSGLAAESTPDPSSLRVDIEDGEMLQESISRSTPRVWKSFVSSAAARQVAFFGRNTSFFGTILPKNGERCERVNASARLPLVLVLAALPRAQGQSETVCRHRGSARRFRRGRGLFWIASSRSISVSSGNQSSRPCVNSSRTAAMARAVGATSQTTKRLVGAQVEANCLVCHARIVVQAQGRSSEISIFCEEPFNPSPSSAAARQVAFFGRNASFFGTILPKNG